MPDIKNQLYLIIHGHFYQPPREDPWTGTIDRQDSAYPYHDWNERINNECYAANADSRTLNQQGQIVNIINNYEYISFNFGPTLLIWLEKNDPVTYNKIIEADRISAGKNNGHGNAIAQVYNHIIMPLANTADKFTQILWGLYDFKKRFGRDSEGMWLAETAVNIDTIEALIECGIKYIILSPTQAESIRSSETDEWHNVENNSVDTSQAYHVNTKKGHIAVFFYDKDIAKSVGFEHILTNSDNFRDRIIASDNEDKPACLVNIATDGESYGHHEPFANMCLADMINDNNHNNHFIMTNYGKFLEEFPPVDEVHLKDGNNCLGTAWSCSHGVGRWMEDCGCSNGGPEEWTQAWRKPLRMAFDFLRNNIAVEAEQIGNLYLKNFWNARNDYISLIMENNETARKSFFNKHAKKTLDIDEQRIVLTLFEAQKFALFMYTSCGWFFSEISGIEGVQCQRYALRALELMTPYLPENTEEKFTLILEDAPSNIPHFGNGKRVFYEIIKEYVLDESKVVNQYVMEKFLTPENENSGSIYFYSISLYNIKEVKKNGSTIFYGSAYLKNNVTLDEKNFLFYIIRSSHLEIKSYLKPYTDEKIKEYIDSLIHKNSISDINIKIKDWFTHSYSLNDVKFDSKETLVKGLFEQSFMDLHALRTEKMDEYLDLIEFYARNHVPIPSVEKSSLEATINNEIAYQLPLLEDDIDELDFHRVARMIKSAKSTGLKINYNLVEELFSIKIDNKLQDFLTSRNESDFNSLVSFISFSNKSQLNYKRKHIENKIFKLLYNQILPNIDSISLNRKFADFSRQLIKLGDELNIQTHHIRKKYELIIQK